MITISKATNDDAKGIREVSKYTWIATFPNDEYGITKEDLEARFSFSSQDEEKKHTKDRQKAIEDDTTQQYFVARENSKVIGFCFVKKEEARNILQALHVLPEYQNKGIGKKLVNTALAWLGNEKDIQLTVAIYNDKAIKFYEKIGFEKTGKSVVDEVTKLPSGKYIPQIEMIKQKSA